VKHAQNLAELAYMFGTYTFSGVILEELSQPFMFEAFDHFARPFAAEQV
jgi:hypothetical protein